ncbi:nuclear exosome regulator NRDE2-like isoform X2 [Daktulosphaira vitifoliae]|uniref:nuclear exosome regulator NRDE2-like isoform X2 n=1 Tax=Daktulosphaira vitifoliae TaxID=58002 RepID=UPI0021AA56E7|nr:nuclear exosome regulator NRDE2-like isoform X2 [Daktulosphaira vitifoliae]
MSLFPAYLNNAGSPGEELLHNEEKTLSSEWLKNSSFEPNASELLNKKTVDKTKKLNVHESYKLYKKRHGKSSKKHFKEKNLFIKSKDAIKNKIIDCELVMFDRKPELGNLKVDKLYRPAAPNFHFIKYKYLNEYGWVYKKSKPKKLKRYYCYKEKYFGDISIEINNDDNDLKENKLLLNSPLNDNLANENSNLNSVKCEKNLTLRISDYNRCLLENPKDVKLWIEFVNFQDTLHNLNKNYGSRTLSNRNCILEKKLAILDKALLENPECHILLDKRWTIAAELLTSDKMKEELLKEINKCNSTNLTLWYHYINVIQSSLSDCNNIDVLKSYSDAMFAINKVKYNLQIEKKIEIDKKIVELFFKCGLFLRQAGHYEQLLTLINMYLTVNINNFDNSLMEKFYMHTSEDILFSNDFKAMPLNKAWYQVETLRTRDHWIPLPKNLADSSDDPQRVVLPEDVSELVQPITNHHTVVVNLVSVCCILLKMPILPYRHFVVRQLGIDNYHFNFESLEMILSSIFMAYNFKNYNQINDRVSDVLLVMLKTAMPPHYYDDESTPSKTYSSFVISILRHITDCLYAMDYTSEANIFLVWWLRFERYKIAIKSTSNNSKLVSEVKLLLQKPQYRNNIPLFIEFALLKNQVGKADDALKILQKIIDSQHVLLDSKPIYESITYRATFTAIYRNMLEIVIQLNNRDRAIKILVGLATGSLPNNADLNFMDQANNTFNRITNDCLADRYQFSHSNLAYNFLPQFFVEWVACYAWFLYFTQNIQSAVSMIKRVIYQIEYIIESNNYETNHAAVEILYETLIIILNHYCNKSKTGHKQLRKHLRYTISKYPQNMQFLFSMMWNETKYGGFGTPLWQIENVYIDQLIAENLDAARIMLILIGRERLRMASELAKDNFNTYQLSMSKYVYIFGSFFLFA